MNKFKKIVALLIAVICVFSLTACARGATVMSYKEYTVNEAYYTYWLSRFKASFIDGYSDVEDTDEYYDSVITDDGRTANEVMTELSDSIIKNYLVCEYLCDYYGLKLTKNILSQIDKELDAIVEGVADGSKNAFNGIAAQYGINLKMLRDIYIIETKSQLFYEFYASNYITPSITDSVREAFLRDDYTRADFIYISTEYAFRYDNQGNLDYGDNGDYRVPLTDEKKAEKLDLIAKIEGEINSQNYLSLREKHNEDPAKDAYPSGYYFNPDMQFDSEVINALREMTPAEIRKVETEHGVYFLRKLSVEPSAYSIDANRDFFEDFETRLVRYLYDKMIEEEIASVTYNDEVKKNITIKSVKPCYDF